MRAAAQLQADPVHFHDAHSVAVLLSEERHGAGLHGFVVRSLVHPHRPGGPRLLVDPSLHLGEFGRGHGGGMGEVEAQPVGRHERPPLHDVAAEHGAKRRMQQVRGRVVAFRVPAERRVHAGRHLRLQEPLGRRGRVLPPAAPLRPDQIAVAKHGLHVQAPILPDRPDPAPVRHLSPAFDVEGMLLQGQAHERGLERSAADDSRPDRRALEGDVALTLLGVVHGRRFSARPALSVDVASLRPRPSVRSGTLPLFGQGPLESRHIHVPAPFGRLDPRQVRRKAEGVVKAKDLLAGHRGPGASARRTRGRQGVQASQAAFHGGQEAILLAPGRGQHMLPPGRELRVGVRHLVHDGRGHFGQDGLALAQQPGMAHAPAKDAPQHVPAPLVGRKHAVGQQERHGAGVVGQHPVRHALGRILLVRTPREFGHPVQQGQEQVGVVVGSDPLEHRGQALQARARVDAGGRKRPQVPLGTPVELHEDQVPELQELASLAARLELGRVGRRSAFRLRAQVVVDLRTRAAGSGVGHLPEVVLVAQPVDPL